MTLLLLIIRLLNPAPVIVALPRPRQILALPRKLAVISGAMAIVLPGVWFLIWASYGFRFAMFNPAISDQKDPRPLFHEPGVLNAIGKFAEQEHLLPQGFLFSYSYMLERTQGNNAFLNGEFSTRGWLSFFPYCMAVKTPLELFVLLALAAAVAWIFRTGLNYSPNKQIGSNSPAQPSKLYEVTPLLVLLSVYWAFALTSNMNIGHRHVLPTYPPLFIVAGAAGLWFPVARTDQRKWVGAIHWVIVVALILSAAEALWFWPNYLAYFNIFVGGPRYGYKHLVDSSLDWSQDAKELKRWFDNHPADVLPPQRVYLSFFGDTPLEYFGIEATKLPSFLSPWQPHVEESLHGGTYCISATELQNVFLEPCPGRWNKRYEEAYQLLRHNVELYRRSQSDPALQEQSKQFATPEEWNKMFDLYERLRFSRLCSFLRQREPDDEVGYSILIYRLSDADVSRALDGPPVELLEKPETKDK